MFSVSQLNNFGRQYHYLFNFRCLIGRYIVLYFLPKKPLLTPTNHKIRGSVGSQDGAYCYWSVATSLCWLPTNLYTLVVCTSSRGIRPSKRTNPQACSTMPVVTLFSLKVAWSGKSLIQWAVHNNVGFFHEFFPFPLPSVGIRNRYVL